MSFTTGHRAISPWLISIFRQIRNIRVPYQSDLNPHKTVASQLYLILWIALATVHLTQSVWISGWTEVPGTSVDGQLNNLLLEHGFQALRGVYPFSSPGQFFPVEGTLAYSDAHWGTLPVYAAARTLGFSVWTAFQIWAVVLAAANGFAVLYLTRVCRIPWVLAGPICFIATAPAALVWFTGGHIQLLPFFPFPLALAQIILWNRSRQLVHLINALGFLCWLHLCSPYLGFFATAALVCVILVSCLLPRPAQKESGSSLREQRVRWWLAIVFLVLSSVPTLLLYGLYFLKSKNMGTRAWVELADLAPVWQSWVTAPPGHWLYGGGWPVWSVTNLSEHALFSGWIIWLGTLVCLLIDRSSLRVEERAQAFCYALTALLGILVFTRWTDDGAGIFLWFAGFIDAFRAFRGSGRVIIVIHILQSLALGLLLTYYWRRFAALPARCITVAIAVLMAVEIVSVEQPGTPKAWLKARRDAVLEAWRVEGDRPILVLAPGHTNQYSDRVHLDAWSASLASGRKTLNGFSGNRPASHALFQIAPTERNAQTIVRSLNLDADEMSVVKTWGTGESELGIVHFESQPVQELQGFSLQPAYWDLTFPIESFLIDQQPVHQIAPRATVRFDLPEGVRSVSFLLGMREGAYNHGGNSDGFGVQWTTAVDGVDRILFAEYWNPRDRPEHRGLVPITFALPERHNGTLTLTVDYGPEGNGLWDWPLFGRLEAD